MTAKTVFQRRLERYGAVRHFRATQLDAAHGERPGISHLTAENLRSSQSQEGASFVPSAGVQRRVVRTNSSFEACLSPSREPKGFEP